MKKNLYLLLLIFYSSIHANTYELYIASTKYENVAKQYLEEVNDILKIENLIIRNHEKKNFSLIVRDIQSIEEAKRLKYILKTKSIYKDSFIKKITVKPSYTVLYEAKIILDKKDENEIYRHKIESSNEYITASTMYNIEDYNKAYDLFYKLFLKYNNNININYFLAQSAIKIKKYDEATAALERVLIQNPNMNKARYEYAKLLYNLNIKEEAKKEFNILLEKDITNEIKYEIKKYLEILNKKPKLFYTQVTLITGVGQSTNVNNGLTSNEYNLPGLNNITVSGEKPIKDSFHNEILVIDFNNILKDSPAFKLKNSFLIYNKNFFNETQENITVFGYKPSISYFHDQYLYQLAFNMNNIVKENKESFNTYSLTPTIINESSLLSLSYQRALYSYFENENKDFYKYEFIFRHKIINNFDFFSKISKTTRIEDNRIDIDKVSVNGGFDYNYEINNKNMIQLSYQFEESDYKYENLLFDSTRKDKNHLTGIDYSYLNDDGSRFILSSGYIKNFSNQDAYNYKEIETKINYMKNFNW